MSVCVDVDRQWVAIVVAVVTGTEHNDREKALASSLTMTTTPTSNTTSTCTSCILTRDHIRVRVTYVNRLERERPRKIAGAYAKVQ